MIHALDHIHKESGISVLDINEGNIFMCPALNGELSVLKFGNLGFVRFFGDNVHTPEMKFGTTENRSPLATAWHTESHPLDQEGLGTTNSIELKHINNMNKEMQGSNISFDKLETQTKTHFIQRVIRLFF